VTHRLDGTPLVKVLDFGIAKAQSGLELDITTTATIMGSPGYMSPEQLRSARDVDGRSDLWSLGVILYELVTGRLPFTGATIMELAMKIAIEPPAPLPSELDPRLAAVIARCLDKDLARRYDSVGALASELAEIAGVAGGSSATMIARLSHHPRLLPSARVQVPVADVAHAPTTLAATHGTGRRALVVVGAVALLAGAGVVGYLAMHRAAPREPARPDASPVVIDTAVVVAAAPDALVARDAGAESGDAAGDAQGAIDPALRADLEKQIRSHDWRAVLDFADLAARDPSLAPLFAQARAAYGVQAKRGYDAAIKSGQCDRAHAIARDLAQRHLDTTAFAAACPATPAVPAPPTVPVDDPEAAMRLTGEAGRMLKAGNYADAMHRAGDAVKQVTRLSQWMYTLAACDAKNAQSARDHFAKISPSNNMAAGVRAACAQNHVSLDP
jgi:hypothetical protein